MTHARVMWALPELRSEHQAQRLLTVMLLVKVVQLTSYVEEVQMGTWEMAHWAKHELLSLSSQPFE